MPNTIQDNMQDLVDALDATGLKFAHFGWSKAPSGDYGVYAEEHGVQLRADNSAAERVTQLTVDYFTRDASGTPRETIEDALNACVCAWSLNNVMFENDTGFIHYEWLVQI